MNITQADNLQTERLLIRKAAVNDREFILRLLNEPSWLEFIGNKNIRNADAAEAYISTTLQGSYERNGFGLMVVEIRGNGVPIGLCGLLKRDHLRDVDLGYAFLPEYWGKGYAFETAERVIADGRDSHGFKRIVAITLPQNRACIKVLTKLGFVREAETWLGDDPEVLSLYGLDLSRTEADYGH